MGNLKKYSDNELLEILNTDIEEEIRQRGYEFGWYKKEKYSGEIYILVNPAFPNLVKIGYADDTEKRVKYLNRNSGLPDPYHVYATYKVKKRLEDLKLHNLIDSLDSDLRYARNREFYEMSPEKAYSILQAIAEINGDDELIRKNPLDDSFFSENENADNLAAIVSPSIKKERKPKLTFSLLGIKKGEFLRFSEDRSIRCIVNGNDTVIYEGKEYTLSGLTRYLKESLGTGNKSGAYQGGNFFEYNGKTLCELREEIEKSEGEI